MHENSRGTLKSGQWGTAENRQMGLKQDIDGGGRNGIPFVSVNVLSEAKQQQVIALGRLAWSLRRIEKETKIRRETAAAYLKAAGTTVWLPGAWGHRPPANPANEVSPDSALVIEPTRSPTASACEPFFDFIELSLGKGRNAKAIYQDLVDDYGFAARYQSVKRFVVWRSAQPSTVRRRVGSAVPSRCSGTAEWCV